MHRSEIPVKYRPHVFIVVLVVVAGLFYALGNRNIRIVSSAPANAQGGTITEAPLPNSAPQPPKAPEAPKAPAPPAEPTPSKEPVPPAKPVPGPTSEVTEEKDGNRQRVLITTPIEYPAHAVEIKGTQPEQAWDITNIPIAYVMEENSRRLKRGEQLPPNALTIEEFLRNLPKDSWVPLHVYTHVLLPGMAKPELRHAIVLVTHKFNKDADKYEMRKLLEGEVIEQKVDLKGLTRLYQIQVKSATVAWEWIRTEDDGKTCLVTPAILIDIK